MQFYAKTWDNDFERKKIPKSIMFTAYLFRIN